MTCIAAIVHDGAVFIGGDSAGVADWNIDLRADEKVFVVGDFLIGIAGSFRTGNLMRYRIDPPKQRRGEDPVRYMTTTFVDHVREVFGTYGAKSSEHGLDTTEGIALVAYKGGLYYLCADFQVGTYREPFAAIGLGRDLAMGALYATRTWRRPRERITTALEAAERYSGGVRGPFVILRST